MRLIRKAILWTRTQRQTQFQPITSAETREGQGEAEDDEGRKDAPSVGAAIDGARQKNKTRKASVLRLRP